MNRTRMLPEYSSFFIRGDDGEEYGPVDLNELREWVRENRAGLGTEARRNEPGATWNSWQSYPELVALLAAAQAGGPLPLHPTGLTLSPIWKRILTWIVDIIFLTILVFNPLQMLLNHFIPMQEIMAAMFSPAKLQALPTPLLLQLAAVLVIENALLVIYLTVCHSVYGKTPAQALLGMRVVTTAGEKPTVTRAFIRSLALVFSVNFYVPLVYIFFNPQRRAFHDLVSDTWVVNTS